MLDALIRATIAGDKRECRRLLVASPELARQAVAGGAARSNGSEWFVEAIGHHIYGGDTALHVAAAARREEIVVELLGRGANVRARNRRGAEPLHYAADGGPGSASWNPPWQADVIRLLIAAGADPNAVDKSSVAPLHRAIRCRSAAAVRALLAGGADRHLVNGNGTTPLHLARHGSGKSGSGSAAAHQQQEEIIAILQGS